MSKTKKIDGADLKHSSSIEVGKALRKTHPLNAHEMIKARPKGFDSNAIFEISPRICLHICLHTDTDHPQTPFL
ncbi:hypothetical protein [Polynucleobacter alcilacus]|uniref:hypothetical protein n=1 Tax=Polynucleobacter alcilacus TaxID=1819739 RepID=UPI001C0BFA95|nr:hypothetical protein [Polynucleobacter alcilacus]MBU3567457.1 hypothetical protein [Polynucleobacter alcilacus]